MTLVGRVLLMTLFMMAFQYGVSLEMAIAYEYGSKDDDIANSEGTLTTESSISSNDDSVIVNQQNECEGNIVICQNILTKFVCSDKAICIMGNLDPFLLVLPN
ncbi:MAG: hypothetical protein ACRD5E_11810 [Nitrososphaeraceae archaeon]